MKCLNCGKEVGGRGKYCSDGCKQAAYRNRKEPETVTNEPSSVTSVTAKPTVTDYEWSVLLDMLPAGVSLPKTMPTELTANLTFKQIDDKLTNDRNWIEKPEYAERIYRLLTWSNEQLKDVWLPAWSRIEREKPSPQCGRH